MSTEQQPTDLPGWLLSEAIARGERRFAEAADRIENAEREVERLRQLVTDLESSCETWAKING